MCIWWETGLEVGPHQYGPKSYGADSDGCRSFLLHIPRTPMFLFHNFARLKMSRFRLLHLLFTSAASGAALSDWFFFWPNRTAVPLSAAYEPCTATENKIYFLRASYSMSLLLWIWSWLKHLGTWVWISISPAKFLSISGPILSQVLDLVWGCFSNSNHSAGGHWLCKSSEISLMCNPSRTYRQLTPQLIYLHSPINSSHQLNP
jgi:hypothetical protein